jgi:GGDEF domain-containing protein
MMKATHPPAYEMVVLKRGSRTETTSTRTGTRMCDPIRTFSRCRPVGRTADVVRKCFCRTTSVVADPGGFLRSRSSIDLAQEPPRYPLALAACWIGGCGVIDATTQGVLRTEPFYLPAVLALAWFYGLRAGLIAAVGAAVAASAAELATGNAGGIGPLSWNLVAHAVLFALPAWLVCEWRVLQRRLARLDTTHAATGFMTRHGLLQALAEELARTERLGGETSVICIGLNSLPRLAAERGREQARTVQRGFCDAIRLSTRRIDTVAYLAEDEFALLLRGTGSPTVAVVADKLAHSLTDWLLTQGHDLTCSVGFTTAPRGRLLDADTLLAQAVAHLYERRSAGPTPEQQPVSAASAVTRVTAVRESA